MKKLILILANLLVVLAAVAQSPEKMNYQAVARDLSGVPLVNTSVNLQFDILQGSSTGAVEYSETQTQTTNQFGLFNAEIGSGNVLSGTPFSLITWGSNLYYLRITVNGDVMPATQLLSVPYALYSKQSANGPPGLDGLNCWDTNGNGIQDAVEDLNGDGSWDALDCQGSSSGVDADGDGWPSNLDLNDADNTVTFYDADNDTLNEIQDLTWNTADSNIINISGGAGLALSSNAPAANQVLTWNGANWTAQTLTGGAFNSNGTQTVLNNITDNVGIGVASPTQRLEVEAQTGNQNAISGVNNQTGLGTPTYGIYGFSAGDSFGDAGLVGESNGNSGAGVLGVNSNNQGGYGVRGVFSGSATSVYSAGVVGQVTNAAASSTTQGLYGVNLGLGVGVRSYVMNGASNEKTSLDVAASSLAPAPGLGSRIDFSTGTSGGSAYPIASITATATNTTFGSSLGDLSFSTVQNGNIRNKRMIILSDGKVGIGTTSPNGLLQVNGVISSQNYGVAAKVKVKNAGGSEGAETSLGTAQNIGSYNFDAWDPAFGAYRSTSKIVGTTTAAHGSGDTPSKMRFLTTPQGSFTAVERMVINDDGNIGIGVAAPAAKLDVLGTVKIEDGTQGAGKVLTSDALGNASWQTPASSSSLWSGSAGVVYLTNTTDNVGIGTTSPSTFSQLNVESSAFDETVRFYNTNTLGSNVTGIWNRVVTNTAITAGPSYGIWNGVNNQNNSTTLTDATFANYSFTNNSGSGDSYGYYYRDFSPNGTSYGVYIDNEDRNYFSGNVGIGTATPASNLDVLGTFKLKDGTEGLGKILTSDAAGNATWQNLPQSISFSANVSSTSIPSGTTTALIYDNVEYDNGGNFNVGSGQFVAPQTGVYHFDAVVTFDASSAYEIQIQIMRNGGTHKVVTVYADPTYPSASAHISADVYLPVSNSVSIGIYQNSAGNISPVGAAASSRVYFSGHLIR